MKPLLDYPNKCGSCKHFMFLITEKGLRYRGKCEPKNKYKQACDKACRKYEVEI